MAKYTGKQSVLDEALGEYKDYGFRLEESKEDTYILYFKEKQIAVYYRVKVTFDAIREGCKNFLNNTQGY